GASIRESYLPLSQVLTKGTLHDGCRITEVETGRNFCIRHPTSSIQAAFFSSLSTPDDWAMESDVRSWHPRTTRSRLEPARGSAATRTSRRPDQCRVQGLSHQLRRPTAATEPRRDR